jgi:hypothetical protein
MKKKIFSLMAVVLFVGSSMNMNALTFYNCVDFAWAEADRLNELSGNQWSSWDLWDVTNSLYEDCINE